MNGAEQITIVMDLNDKRSIIHNKKNEHYKIAAAE
jgi:hypothetical protein